MDIFSKKLTNNSRYNVLSVVGAGFGDEGKGKVTDLYASKWAEVVVRANGGCNAGHTVTINGNKASLRALPSGILSEGVENVICHGCVINPIELVEEINKIKKIVNFDIKLHISDRAHVITEYDIQLDEAFGKSIKTTGNGIGMCYADKAYRKGLRICDLYKSNVEIAKKLSETMSNITVSNETFFQKLEPIDVANKLKQAFEVIEPYICDTSVLLNKYIKDGANVLFEGAQAAMLDNAYGFYPFVTSSNPTTAGLSTGSGVAPYYFNNNIGVIKAYCTRVGEGPFVTEFNNELSDEIREKAHEYGTVTGRPRRIGWFDCVIMKQGNRLNGYSSIALMLLDVLSGIDTIKICINYIDEKGKVLESIPADANELYKIKPQYLTLPGWAEDISKCKSFSELPKEAKNFVETIEEQINIPINIISVGPDREQTIFRD